VDLQQSRGLVGSQQPGTGAWCARKSCPRAEVSSSSGRSERPVHDSNNTPVCTVRRTAVVAVCQILGDLPSYRGLSPVTRHPELRVAGARLLIVLIGPAGLLTCNYL
jgi:hypothetical protein